MGKPNKHNSIINIFVIIVSKAWLPLIKIPGRAKQSMNTVIGIIKI
jgi:hypothetical protein